MKSHIRFFLHFILSTVVHCQTIPGDELVTLKLSDKTNLIGTKEYITGEHGRSYYAYRGIRFAEAPTGEKRWKESKLLELAGPEYNATRFGNVCWQNPGIGLIGDEDCLFLNVYTPTSNEAGASNVKKLLPVMFYIHGGGFTVGHSGSVGPQQLLQHDVVLVSVNYRLGVLGYLSSGSSNLPGNYGALDQVTALDWVQKYIHHFGGDPKSVTIFGHSAGGASVHLLTMSPRAKGKYHKAIVHSGSALNSWVVDERPERCLKSFANRLNCTQNSSTLELVKCLQGKTAKELLVAQQASLDFGIQPLIWGSAVDGESRGKDAFLPQHPEVILDKGLYNPTPIMTGITSEEGLFFSTILNAVIGNKFADKEYFKNEIIPKAVHSILPFGYDDHVKGISEQVFMQYFSGNETEDEKIKLMSQIYGDSMFYSGQFEALTKYAKHDLSKIYSYIFTYRTPKSTTVIWRFINALRGLGINSDLFDTAVTHLDDMIYIFYPDSDLGFDPKYKMSAEDSKFAYYLTGILAAFAKNGDPAKGIKTSDGFSKWKSIGPGVIHYYNLTATPEPMELEFREEEAKFWRKIYQLGGK